jgi:hypothetical protein
MAGPGDIQAILFAIEDERKRQDEMWGGPTHDDEHVRRRWLDDIIIGWFIRKARGFSHLDSDALKFEENMVKVAALAVAAIQSSRRKRQCKAAVDTATSVDAALVTGAPNAT